MGIVFDIRKYSVHDGPGIRTTVFLKGCPLSCAWCHNPESQSFEPELIFRESRCIGCGACEARCAQAAIHFEDGYPVTDPERCTRCQECLEECAAEARQFAGREMSVSEVMAEVERDLPFYEESGGGVTFSGGEPLSQPDFLLELLQTCKALDLHTTLDTCGQADWSVIERVRPYVDLFLYDLKLMDEEQHRRYTGISNRLILENLERLAQRGEKILLRVPIIPGVTDSAENLEAIGAFAAELPGVERIDLLPYHGSAEAKYIGLDKSYQLAQLSTPDDDSMAKLGKLFEPYGLNVRIGG